MLKLLTIALALLWACCVLFRSVPAGQSLRGGYTRPAPSPAPKPRGLEWRKVRRLGGRIIAIRLQILMA